MNEHEDDCGFERVQLTEEEERLFVSLQGWLEKIDESEKAFVAQRSDENLANLNAINGKGGQFAYLLYNSLKARNIEVKYDGWFPYRVESLGCGPERLEFHQDKWPVHDLIAFIKNKNAHNKIENCGINKTFEFKVFCAHRTTDDLEYFSPVSITRTAKGWKTQYWEKITEEDDKCCSNLITFMEEINGIYLPYNIGELFEKIWTDADEGYLSQGNLYFKLTDVFNWISEIERNKPKWV